ncbi:MAG TPA: rhamnogalacturonan acetylesterase [Verrucomicrobiae bacterium]|nr:rhamnogalacturonan acetylesterase [Verrucomicrobiae bacterium]
MLCSRPMLVFLKRLNAIAVPALAAGLAAGCQSSPGGNLFSPVPPPSRQSRPAPSVAQGLSAQSSANWDVHRDAAYRSHFLVDTHRTFPMLFIVGDSTVHNPTRGERGWGDVIGKYFDTNRIRVENHALGGRSSRTFITQGWWNLILQAAKPGDFVLIQLGHNDGGPLDDPYRARGSIRGIGNESKEIYNPLTHRQEVVHTYGWYLRKYLADARARGMTPILCSPVPHVPKTEVKAGDVEHWDYVRWSGEVATNEHALFINLNQIVLSHYAGLTPAEIKAKYFTPADNTHSSPAGAELNAECVVAGLRQLDCPLKNYLLPAPGGS